MPEVAISTTALYSVDIASPETVAKAEYRFSRLAYLLSAPGKPHLLHALDAEGFVDGDIQGRFGLTFAIPNGVLTTHNPVLLHQLLDRHNERARTPLPTLGQRYRLAAQA